MKGNKFEIIIKKDGVVEFEAKSDFVLLTTQKDKGMANVCMASGSGKMLCAGVMATLEGINKLYRDNPEIKIVVEALKSIEALNKLADDDSKDDHDEDDDFGDFDIIGGVQ